MLSFPDELGQRELKNLTYMAHCSQYGITTPQSFLFPENQTTWKTQSVAGITAAAQSHRGDIVIRN